MVKSFPGNTFDDENLGHSVNLACLSSEKSIVWGDEAPGIKKGGPGMDQKRPRYHKSAMMDSRVQKGVESPGIDPGASRMLSERSTI